MCFAGMGWDGKFHGDGAGMGLIFTTVSLFTTESDRQPDRPIDSIDDRKQLRKNTQFKRK